MIIIYSYIPSISRSSLSLLPTPSLVALLPVMLHIEEKWRHYLVHVINVPNVQLHTVLVSYLFDDSPKTLQSRKSCPTLFSHHSNYLPYNNYTEYVINMGEYKILHCWPIHRNIILHIVEGHSSELHSSEHIR